MPLASSGFLAVPRDVRTRLVEGLATCLDAVADAAAETHRFLRLGWFAAALEAYGGRARTLVVEADGAPVLALPLRAHGPVRLGIASVPGSYWPFRGFPLSLAAGEDVLVATLAALTREVRVLRIGPVHEDDAAVRPLLMVARAQGWSVLSRHVARAHVFDMVAAQTAGSWPRNSTLRKNRFHEKHLAEHGTLEWRFPASDQWSHMFDVMAQVEATSWIATRTDGRDAKFMHQGHGAFWRAAARDPVLARMFHAALLTVDGHPAAFSFDLDVGPLKHAIANSYDPAFAKHSPGKLLYYRNLVAAAERGTTRVDWGAGDSGYKATIGAVPGAAIVDLLLVAPGLPGTLARPFAPLWRRSGQQDA